LQPDVILMDVRMPVRDGVAATRIIHERHPGIKILVLTTFDDDEYIVQALQSGASGYLLKDVPTEQLAQAIRAACSGSAQLGMTVMSKILSHVNACAVANKTQYQKMFTNRELEVLQLLGQGKNNKEIAQTLYITEGTVKNHITRILTQLNLRDRTQAALWSQQHI
ncbi:MAG: response regulator transcription factor, partial [Candidatus Melainabacteria bacterium]|nr:response regulator transcription factor [Candidatus Melainabacteria bacterium]